MSKRNQTNATMNIGSSATRWCTSRGSGQACGVHLPVRGLPDHGDRQLQPCQSCGPVNFKEDVQAMCEWFGKSIGILFPVTDDQIVDEQFLFYMNDMLPSENIPSLFPTEDIDEIRNSIHPEVK